MENHWLVVPPCRVIGPIRSAILGRLLSGLEFQFSGTFKICGIPWKNSNLVLKTP